MSGYRAYRGAEVLDVGLHRGNEYTAKDLHDIELNFQDFSTGPNPYVEVPAVGGHVEQSDVPAIGWTRKLSLQGDKLKADFRQVPVKLARKIDAGAYKRASIEAYPAPPDGIPREAILEAISRRGIDRFAAEEEARTQAPALKQAGDVMDEQAAKTMGRVARLKPVVWYEDALLRRKLGRMARRVAFLGGEIPQVKTLAQFPESEEDTESYAERLLILRTVECLGDDNRIHCFSEVGMATRDEMLAKLNGMGCKPGAMDKLDDDAMSECLKLCDKAGRDKYGEESLDEMEPDKQMPHLMGGIQKYMECGEKRFGAKWPMKSKKKEEERDDMSEAEIQKAIADGIAAALKGHADKFAEDAKRALKEQVDKFSEDTKAAQADLAAARKMSAQLKSDTKRASIDKFCEAERNAGKIPASEFDKGKDGRLLTVAERLMLLDDTAVVHKFSEGGNEVALTALDVEMDAIKRRQPFICSEKIGKGNGNPAETLDSDLREIEKYAEENADELKALGDTKETFMAPFKTATPEARKEFLKSIGK